MLFRYLRGVCLSTQSTKDWLGINRVREGTVTEIVRGQPISLSLKPPSAIVSPVDVSVIVASMYPTLNIVRAMSVYTQFSLDIVGVILTT